MCTVLIYVKLIPSGQTRRGFCVYGGAISVPIDAAVCPCCNPSRVSFSVSEAGTDGEVQVVELS